MYANRHNLELRGLGIQAEDFIQDVFLNLLRRSAQKFDLEKVTSLPSFIFLLGKRHLIDLKRKRNSQSRKGRTFSLDYERDEARTTFADEIEDEGGNFDILLFELVESVTEEQISPNYRLSWRELLKMSLEFKPEEIAERVGISGSRIKQLQGELQEMVS